MRSGVDDDDESAGPGAGLLPVTEPPSRCESKSAADGSPQRRKRAGVDAAACSASTSWRVVGVDIVRHSIESFEPRREVLIIESRELRREVGGLGEGVISNTARRMGSMLLSVARDAEGGGRRNWGARIASSFILSVSMRCVALLSSLGNSFWMAGPRFGETCWRRSRRGRVSL